MKAPSPHLLHSLRKTTYIRPHAHRLHPPSLSSTSLSSHRQPFSTTPLAPDPNPSTSSRPSSNPDRGPPSKEDTQTDFGAMNVLGNTPVPPSSIDACVPDGFHFSSGLKISGGSGCMLVSGEAFVWRPWESDAGGKGRRGMLGGRGAWEVGDEGWGVLRAVWPKPDMLILGLGASTYPLAPRTKRYLNSLGIKVDVSDTRNAAAQYNLLATERGVGSIAAALLPIGWNGGV